MPAFALSSSCVIPVNSGLYITARTSVADHMLADKRKWSALVCAVQGRRESCCDCQCGSCAACGAVCWSQRRCVKRCCLSSRIDVRATKTKAKLSRLSHRHSDNVDNADGVLGGQAFAERRFLIANNYCHRGVHFYTTFVVSDHLFRRLEAIRMQPNGYC